MSEVNLSDKDDLFCREFVIDLNATQAYKRVHPKAKVTTCRTESSKLLAKPNIRSRINELIVERSAKTEIEAETVLRELYALATVDPIEIFTDDHRVKSLGDMPKSVRKAIAGIDIVDIYEGIGQDKMKVGEIKKIKFWDKNKSLENLGRHLRLFTDNVKLEIDIYESMSDDELKVEYEKALEEIERQKAIAEQNK